VKTEDLHAAAGVPIQFVCIGRKLLPLSLGHLEILERCGCLAPSDVSSLCVAVMVCAIPSEKWDAFISSRWFGLAMWLWRRSVREWNFETERAAFMAYLHHEMTGPPFSRAFGSGACARSYVPTSRYLSVFLCSRLGHDPERVRSYRYRDALWDHYTLGEMDGRGRVDEEPLEEFLERAEASMPPKAVMDSVFAELHRIHKERTEGIAS
jgi:hypothetical protein